MNPCGRTHSRVQVQRATFVAELAAANDAAALGDPLTGSMAGFPNPATGSPLLADTSCVAVSVDATGAVAAVCQAAGYTITTADAAHRMWRVPGYSDDATAGPTGDKRGQAVPAAAAPGTRWPVPMSKRADAPPWDGDAGTPSRGFFVRVYSPDLSGVQYSSMVTGAFDASGSGGDNVIGEAAWPLVGGVCVAARHNPAASANPAPTSNTTVSWGAFPTEAAPLCGCSHSNSTVLSHPGFVSASQSMQQIWTILRHHGPNHLGLWFDDCRLPRAERGNRPTRPAGGGGRGGVVPNPRRLSARQFDRACRRLVRLPGPSRVGTRRNAQHAHTTPRRVPRPAAPGGTRRLRTLRAARPARSGDTLAWPERRRLRHASSAPTATPA